MKIRCIDNLNGQMSLTLEREYEVSDVKISDNSLYYKIRNDFGTIQYYPQDQFEVVNEKDDKQQIKLQCSECGCLPVCSEKENWRRYCKEHIEMRKKSVLFDSEPSCRYYIDKNVLNQAKTNDVSKKVWDKIEKQLSYDDKKEDIFDKAKSVTKPIFIDLNKMSKREPQYHKDLNDEDFSKILERILGDL